MFTYRRFGFILFCGAMFSATAFPSSLQDWEFNLNGTDYFPAGSATLASVPGLNSAGFNATTGQGTLTVTFNPGTPGTYYVGAFFYIPVGVPFYNEYGVVNGSAATGQNWQIDVPEYDVTSKNHGVGTILDNLANGTLSGTNVIPGTTTNYLNNCGANGGGGANASCNDFVSLATGFTFKLGTNQEEIVTFNLSASNPGGFSLEDVHPVDGSNPSASDIFLSASAAGQTVNVSPEPATWSLAALAVVLLTLVTRKRLKNS